jgi:multisubunit Na+/H+ antiporter MnhB subunit
MNVTSTILVFAGAVCLFLCGFGVYKLRPQEGRPPSRFAQTDNAGTAVALGLLVLALAGISMLLKGIFG